MENRAYTLIAGLFALLLGIGLLAAFWWLGNAHTPQNTYFMTSNKPVSGLNKRAAVRFRGVDVGHVESIDSARTLCADTKKANKSKICGYLNPNEPLNIVVKISVDETLQLTMSSLGYLAGQGLTGLSYIELDDTGTDGTPLGDKPMELRESEMSSIMASGKKVVTNVEEIAANANKLITNLNMVLDEKGRQRISRLLENLDNASVELKPLLKASTATMDAARPSFTKLNTALDEISKIGVTMNEETLPRIHQLTHQLNQDAVSLNRLINTLDENPESLVFGKPAPRPGPAEKGRKP